MEQRKAIPNVNSCYDIIRKVASYQLAQHSSLHLFVVAVLDCSE